MASRNADFPLSFREVIPDQTNPPASHGKDITLNTGASQSTLQDIKVAERAGGYCYADATGSATRNRFIQWRTQHDCLELIETSLDANLIDNHVRYRFADSPVLFVGVHETTDRLQVVLLVVTVNSIHRLSYTHPEQLEGHRTSSGTGAADVALSVFHEASMQATRDPSTFHVIGHVGGSGASTVPHTATAWLPAGGHEALFALAYQSVLWLFTMHAETGQTVVAELKQHTIVPRIFSNITGALRGKTNTNDSQFAVSMVFGDCGQHTVLYALYRDDQVRAWSTRSGHCVATVNCVTEMGGGGSGTTRPQGAQQNLLRRSTAPGNGTTTTTLCAFLSHSLGAEFVTIRCGISPSTRESPDANAGFHMQRVACIPAPPNDLVDFELSGQRLWALWCTAHGDFTVASYALGAPPAAGAAALCWQNATLEQPFEQPSPIGLAHSADPKETYCASIFYPGRFQRDVIAKALLMFGRAVSASAVVAAATAADTATLSMAVLRERVCVAIELEIAAELAACEEDTGLVQPLADEELVELSARHWERFYACAEQYHAKLCQPIGVFGLGDAGAVCVVRKRTFSLLRPCEVLEHLMMQAVDDGGAADTQTEYGGEGEANVRAVQAVLGVEAAAAADLVRLVRVLAALEAQLGDEVKRDVHDRLYRLHMPNVVVAELLASSELDETVFTREFVMDVNQAVQSIGDLRAAMHLLLEVLRMDAEEAEQAAHYDIYQTPRQLLALGRPFAGDLGVSMLAESLKQIALVRYALCRNLLVLQQLLIDRFALACDVLEEVRSNCQPSTVVFVQAYYVMVWLCEVPVHSGYAATTIDHNIQRLNVLQISPGSRRIIRPQQPITLLEFFLRSRGLHAGWTAFADAHPKRSNADEPQWTQTMLPLVAALGQLIWAVSGGFTFGEWLIGSCQHILIQEYVRLLNSWCEWNSCSRHFIAAVTLLETGEPDKAFDLFMQSAKGVLTEPFLESCIVPAEHVACSDNEALCAYYLKTIQLFEQHGALDHVIALAQTAIGVLGSDGDHPQLAMFQSIVFANHLRLEHYDEAYHALVANAEPSRRKDCLRQLVGRLFEQRRPDLLMRFPYVRLQADLEEIVEARARAARIDDNPYYDFLYAFHVTEGNMRRAATVKYEQAMRWQADGASETVPDRMAGVHALQSRYECLLACQNSLHLVDERYAWLARPAMGDEREPAGMETDDTEQVDGDADADAAPTTTRVRVLELADIGRELQRCEAQLQLLRHRSDLHGQAVHVDSEQIVAVLVASGLYTAAVKLARSLPGGGAGRRMIASVLEHLAAACVRADDDGGESADETWNWLKENDLADVPHRNAAAEMAWQLLRKLIVENEDAEDAESGETETDAVDEAAVRQPTGTQLHRAVAGRLIACGVFLPQWLQRSYQRRRPAELLMLLVNAGRLVEASALAVEYVWAMMTTGGEYFGLRHSLHSTKAALCFPATAVDLLLHALEANAGAGGADGAEYGQCLDDVRAVVARYVETVQRVSANRVEYRSGVGGGRLAV